MIKTLDDFKTAHPDITEINVAKNGRRLSIKDNKGNQRVHLTREEMNYLKNDEALYKQLEKMYRALRREVNESAMS